MAVEVAGGVLDPAAPVGAIGAQTCGRARPTHRPARLVVGVDGSLGVLAAVSWAAAEAAATGATVHLVHATSGPRPPDEPTGKAGGRTWLRRAMGAAAAIAPDVGVTVAQLDEPAGHVLATLSGVTDRVVVGGRRRRDVGPHGDATVAHLLPRAHCPVIVVPPNHTGAWASTPSRRPVLAALRGTGHDQLTLELAGEVARRRRVALVAVVGAPAARRPIALAHARRAGARRVEVGDDLLAGLRHRGQQSQLVVVGAPDPDTGWSDEDLAGLLHARLCPAMVVPTR